MDRPGAKNEIRETRILASKLSLAAEATGIAGKRLEQTKKVAYNFSMKQIILGALAHVDAGKTTLSESLLYQSNQIRKRGRVDHQDTFLDYDDQERSRGITIFLKQAMFPWKQTEFTLLDTPGHIDFSAEMERTLQVLDYAIVLISGIDGVQAHTHTIWKLLETYHVPAFVFVNKMDIAYDDAAALMTSLQTQLDPRIIDFTQVDTQMENIAMQRDDLLESYLEQGSLTPSQIQSAVADRSLFPCYFGSALKADGVEALLDGLDAYTAMKHYPETFGARVYKVSRDRQGTRLTHVKITGGVLKAKQVLDNGEKVDQLRLYSGEQFTMVNEVQAGQVCCLKGPMKLGIHDGLGFEQPARTPVLSACLSYSLIPPAGCDPFALYRQLKQLEEEDPQLHLQFHAPAQEIRIQIMGSVQIEILKQLIASRFHLDVEFDEGKINYKETICAPVEGVGHYEPLRHYAEVHLLLEPLPPGSGVQVTSDCPVDWLALPWQKMVLNCLDEIEVPGVLTGSPITDIKITLIAGKAHVKHTEGGDFRQATLRALRQGLRRTTCQLLEPVYQFRMELPAGQLSRALFDLERMQAQSSITQNQTDTVVLEGTAPVSKMRNYQTELTAYTHGLGRLVCTFQGYQPCADQQTLIEAIGYDCDGDLDFPADSVFCSHGAGFLVRYDEVEEHMHIEAQWHPQKTETIDSGYHHNRYTVDDAELKRVMERTHKPKEKVAVRAPVKRTEIPEHIEIQRQKPKTKCLLVDGYNMIHSWSELVPLAQEDLSAARDQLIQLLSSFQGTRTGILILVFDAYQVKDNPGSIQKLHNLYVVYTKTSQTADSYIEKATHQLADEFEVTVATSDGMEQLIIMGQGAMRLSSRELEAQVQQLRHQHRKQERENLEPHRPLKELKTLLSDPEDDQ